MYEKLGNRSVMRLRPIGGDNRFHPDIETRARSAAVCADRGCVGARVGYHFVPRGTMQNMVAASDGLSDTACQDNRPAAMQLACKMPRIASLGAVCF
jgi:hypothetical protein